MLVTAQSLNEQEFNKYADNQNKIISESFDKKDYVQAEKLLNDYITTYDQLSTDLKKKYKWTLPNIYYNLACLYSLQKEKTKALNCFEKAVSCGYSDYLHAIKDTDLDFIRQDKRFRSLMGKLKEKGDYLTILRKANKYNTKENKKLPTFSYQSPNEESLKRVHDYFNLDSIAGEGDEISQIRNLLKWAHNVVRHQGEEGMVKSRNAIDIVGICKKETRGVNCRMMAILLNECYLALGFQSRFVTCLPKSEDDTDCHVINIVYSNTLNKWIWMDPAFNAYLTDENGLLLSIAEVREKLIKGEAIILNEDANWNNQPQTKEQYLTYMAKNLYWFDCPTRGEYNLETWDENKMPVDYISLYPNGYKRKDENKKSQHITNNPDYFWQKPN
jgi:hypothetical protein